MREEKSVYSYADDFKLTRKWQTALREYPQPIVDSLTSVICCQTWAVESKSPDHKIGDPVVDLLVSDQNDARYHGLNRCNNVWSCPHCSVVKMAKRGLDLACAINALAEKNYYAFMQTLTVRHFHFMTAPLTFALLKRTYQLFNHRRGNESRKSYYAQFLCDFDIKHTVQALEFTHGKNNWHPHIHMLLWTRKEYFDKLSLDLEVKLRRRWRLAQAYAACELFFCKAIESKTQLKNTFQSVASDIDWNNQKLNRIPNNELEAFICKNIRIFALAENATIVNKFQGLHWSRDEEGKVVVQKAAKYLVGFSGWNIAGEVTSMNTKIAQKGHRNPRQILEDAIKTGDTKDFDLYIEYALLTKGKKRLQFSRGLNEIIANYKATHPFSDVVKKKDTPEPKWELVASFTELQWLHIQNYEIEHILLEIAKGCNNPRDKIAEVLEEFDIKLSELNPKRKQDLENYYNDTNSWRV